ncbi:DUF4976 domain-containing protein, partial [Verrucomicrobia bacterium]|nr:DUF4976 domain-containing protein [Verrucomicrobiota bacterium]
YIDKRWMYEESHRVPLIVRYPGVVRAGSTSNYLVNNSDFAPTLLQLGGRAEVPDYMQGHSLLPILKGQSPQNWRTATYYRYWMHMAHHDNPAHYGIRTQDYKLIFYYGLPLDAPGAQPTPTQPGWELYDLRNDPHEMHNLYKQPNYDQVAKQLKQELLQLKNELGDRDEKYPELMKVREQYWN